MRRKINRMLSFGLALIMMFSIAGCGSNAQPQAEIDPDTPVSEVQFPLKETEELSFITSAPATSTQDPNERIIFQRLEEQTNVHIKWTCFVSDQFSDKKNLALAQFGNLPDGLFHIVDRHSGYKIGIAAIPIGGNGDFAVDDRLDFVQQCGETTQLHAVASTRDGTAVGMPKHDDDFRLRNAAGKLHASQYVVIQDVASDADTENIPQSLVEDQLGRCAGVYTAEYGCKRQLPFGGLIDMPEQVPVRK